MFLPAQKALPQLGMQSPEVFSIDADSIETIDEFEQQTRSTILEREEVRVSERYSNMQPTSAPTIDKDLIYKWLGVFLQYFIVDDGTELRLIQGAVILVSEGIKIPKKQS